MTTTDETDQLPNKVKWGVCSECGYRIVDSDDVACNTEEFEFIHARCVPTSANGGNAE